MDTIPDRLRMFLDPRDVDDQRPDVRRGYHSANLQPLREPLCVTGLSSIVTRSLRYVAPLQSLPLQCYVEATRSLSWTRVSQWSSVRDCSFSDDPHPYSTKLDALQIALMIEIICRAHRLEGFTLRKILFSDTKGLARPPNGIVNAPPPYQSASSMESGSTNDHRDSFMDFDTEHEVRLHFAGRFIPYR